MDIKIAQEASDLLARINSLSAAQTQLTDAQNNGSAFQNITLSDPEFIIDLSGANTKSDETQIFYKMFFDAITTALNAAQAALAGL